MKLRAEFPYDVKLRLLAHSRSFLANQKARNAIIAAENLLNNNIFSLKQQISCSNLKVVFINSDSTTLLLERKVLL